MDDTKDTVQTIDELEKSWNDSKDTVRALLGEDLEKSEPDEIVVEPITKSDKEIENGEKDGEEDDEGEESKEEEKEDTKEAEGVKKSLSDTMSANSEAEVAMDVEPFLKELVKGINDQFEAMNVQIVGLVTKTDALTKATEENRDLQKASAKLFMSYGEMQKSISNTVEAIGNTAKPSASLLRKSSTRFPKTADDVVMTKDQVMQKATKLREEGKLELRDVTKLENRLNKGMEIPEYIEKLLKEAV